MRKGLFILIVLLVFPGPFLVLADEITSDSFKILDPVVFPSGFSSSDNFRLFDSISQISIGTSTATSFQINSGFLFFPFASAPGVSVTAGDDQVELSWTASAGALGWTVSGYNIGQSTTSGGPYIYTSVGNVTSFTRTGLSNGTTYYFVVRTEDVFGNSIITSSEVSVTPFVEATPVTGRVPDPISPEPGPEEREVEIERKKRADRFKVVDFNNDDVINFVDFSTILFFFNKPIALAAPYDLNNDGKVNLTDISILFSFWGSPDEPGQTRLLTLNQEEDKNPPLFNETKLISNPTDNSQLIVFQASDKESGLKGISSRSRNWLSWSKWRPASSPLRVGAGAWTVQLLSTDNYGNATIKNVYIKQEIFKKLTYALLFAVFIVGIILGKGKFLKWYNKNK